MKTPPYYSSLGVSPDASLSEIRSAYRRLVKRCHPDANPDDPKAEKRFRIITEAYEVLSDATARRKYDRNFHGAVSNKNSTRVKTTSYSTQKRDVRVRLYLTLVQACQGGVKKICYPRTTICVVCNGSGKTGQSGADCKTCSGIGTVKYDHTVKVTYPSGIRPDETLVIGGEGHILSPKLPAGDLLVTVVYRSHPYLEVKANDLHYRCLIGLDHYIQGGRLRVPTISGKTFIILEPLIADGETVNLKGRGLPPQGKHPAGNMVITVRHCLPKKLSRKEMDVVKELMRMPGFSPPIDSKGLFPRGEV